MEKTFKNKKTGELAYYNNGIFKQGNCCIEIGCEPSSEFWEDITNDFKVLMLDRNGIVSVKRLSDEVVFSLGDKYKNASGVFTISGFEIVNNTVVVKGKEWGKCVLNYIEKVVEPIFITQDGVELFGGESVYGVTDNLQLCYTSMATKENVQRCRIFADKNKAENYIKAYKNYTTTDGKQIVEGQTFYVYDDKYFNCLRAEFGQFKSDKWAGKRFKTETEVQELIKLNKVRFSLADMVRIANHWAYIKGVVKPEHVLKTVEKWK